MRATRLGLLGGLVLLLAACNPLPPTPTDTPPTPMINPTVVRGLATPTLSPLLLTAEATQRARDDRRAADQARACDEIAALYAAHGRQYDPARARAHDTELTVTELRVMLYGRDVRLTGRGDLEEEERRRALVNRCLGR